MYKNFITLLAIMALLVIMRVHFLDEPFERDEGGYAYMAQRFLAGDLIYKDYWESRPPGIVFIYALIFKLYGDSLSAVRVFSIFVGLISLILVYLIAERLFTRKTACLSALLYAIFSGGPLIQGSSANAEPFMIVFTLLGIFLFLEDKAFFAGICFGLAFMVKQVAVDGLFAAILLCRKKNMLPLLLGFFTAWIPTIFYLIKNNIFGEFIYATFIYNFSYIKSGYDHNWLNRLYNTILFTLRENSVLWFLGACGLVMLRKNLLVLLWSLWGILAISFSGRFFPHYFIQIIPVLSILGGYALRRKGLLIIVALLSIFTVLNQYKFYFVYSPYEVCRIKYSTEDFVLTELLARKIAKETKENDYIYVWGSEPEIYFYSKRRCPTRFIHNHFMRMDPRFANKGKKEIIEQLSLKKPKIILVFDTLDIFPELKRYLMAKGYERRPQELTYKYKLFSISKDNYYY